MRISLSRDDADLPADLLDDPLGKITAGDFLTRAFGDAVHASSAEGISIGRPGQQVLERGVYPHVAGDGREWVVTRTSAASIRAEDGRCATGVDISSFISGLPSGADTPGTPGTWPARARTRSMPRSIAATALRWPDVRCMPALVWSWRCPEAAAPLVGFGVRLWTVFKR